MHAPAGRGVLPAPICSCGAAPARSTAARAGRLVVAAHTVPIRLSARYRPGERGVARLAFRQLDPAVVADLPLGDGSGVHLLAGAIGMALDGALAARLGRDLRPVTARGRVRAGAGRLVLPGIDPIDLTGLAVDGRLDVAARRLEITRSLAVTGASRVHLAGAVTQEADGSATVDARVQAQRLPVDRLLGWWPKEAAAGARRWLSERRRGGTVEAGDVELHATIPGGGGTATVALTRRHDRVRRRRRSGTTTACRRPPISEAALHLDRRGWTLRAHRGRVGTIELVGGTGTIPLAGGAPVALLPPSCAGRSRRRSPSSTGAASRTSGRSA